MAKHTGVMYSGELLDWGFDWSSALPDGTTISTSSWSISPDVVVSKETSDSGVTAVWITDVTGDETYTLTNEILLSDGIRTYNQSITIHCLDSGSGGGVTVVDAEWADGDPMVWDDDETWVWLE